MIKRFYTRVERIMVLFFLLIAFFFSWRIYVGYWLDHADVKPAVGGIYTEGLVGKPQYLNPLFSGGNPVDRDISQLIFSGLTRYNLQTGKIEDDLAVSERSDSHLTYTFTLLPDLKWHDGQSITSEDVIFTYQTVIQNESFPNAALRDMFDDVKISKIDNRTVTFKLSQPYSFFLANVTFGLLPKHLLELVPVDNIDQSEFNQNPVGSGPFKFLSWVPNGDVNEITLKRNEAYYGTEPKIDTFIFRVFPSLNDLRHSETTLSGYRTRLRDVDELSDDSRFIAHRYELPQYVAMFLNTESVFLKKKKTRFGLLLATNKSAVLEKVGYRMQVDTPILESAEGLDLEYNEFRAQGALFDSEWYLPGKVPTSQGDKLEKEIDKSTQLVFEVEAKGESWVSPVLDGEEKKGFTMKKGDIQKYEVQESLGFKSLGNAGAVFVKVNDVLLKPFGEIGEVLRNVTFDRGSLSEYLPEGVSLDGEELEVSVEAESVQIDEGEMIRVNKSGERFVLRLITAQNPPEYLIAAETIQAQWAMVGIKLLIETYPMVDLHQKISQRDYDILLFGQNLGYNLDSYPFWHSSQAKDGLNLSLYRSIDADGLLVKIREAFDEVKKIQLLDKLKAVIADDNPAIFLYAPTNVVLIDQRVKNVHLNQLSHDADRFGDLPNWYIKEELQLKEVFDLRAFVKWVFGGEK